MVSTFAERGGLLKKINHLHRSRDNEIGKAVGVTCAAVTANKKMNLQQHQPRHHVQSNDLIGKSVGEMQQDLPTNS